MSILPFFVTSTAPAPSPAPPEISPVSLSLSLLSFSSLSILPTSFPLLHYANLPPYRVVLSEARRALFNRESVVEILVNSLIHKDGGSAAAAVATAAAATARVEKGQEGVGAPGEGGGEGELRRVGDGGGRSGVTLVGVVRRSLLAVNI